MALIGPAIPIALLLTADGQQVVHPASDRWWEKVPLLRQASQTDRLRCPDCGARVVLVSESVPAPFFKHYRDLHGCIDQGGTDGGGRRARAWLRHQLVVALRQMLPEGAAIECDDFLTGRQRSVRIRTATGRGALIEIVTDPPDLAARERRREAYQATGLPLFYLFASDRVPAEVQAAEAGTQIVTIHGALNADMIQSLRNDLVDIVHAVHSQTYGLERLEAYPGTLFYFLPGRRQMDGGSLVILRGLLPHAEETKWSGVALRAPMTGEQGGARFSPRHGFYTQADLALLCHYRDHFRHRRRRGQRVDPMGPAASRIHPLSTAWLQKVEWMDQKRRKQEAERARLEAERVEAERTEKERLAARRREVEEDYQRLLEVLRSEGEQLLGGRLLPFQTDLYEGPALRWQSLLVGFVHRAGVSFDIGSAAGWLRSQGLVRRQDDRAELANMLLFWQAAGERRLVNYNAENWIVPVRKYAWPVVAGVHRTPMRPAVCIMCATIHREQRRERAEAWKVFDPVHQLCKCVECP